MFEGAWTALVTPFDEQGRYLPEEYRALIESQAAAGIAGVVPVGTTGESPTLDFDEHIGVIADAVKFARGRMKVMAGTGSNSTSEAIALSQAAVKAGAEALLLVNPYYNRPTQDGLLAHFSAVADAVRVPIVLYNIPGRAAVSLDVATVARLAEKSNIVGIKEAGGDPLRVTQYRRAIARPFVILSGDDAQTLPMMALGADGVISVVSHVTPGKVVDLVRAAQKGDMERARALHGDLLPLIETMFIESSPGPIKHALFRIGAIGSDFVRLPLVRPRPASQATIVSALKNAGLKVVR